MKKILFILLFLMVALCGVTTQHPMGMSNRLTVVLQQELH